jgi:HTH-type transcriptional regulator/antitoxin HipB
MISCIHDSTEIAVDYPVKTPQQLRPLLMGFRKAAGLTQAQVAAHLGVTQQTYAQLEAKPESASLDRLYHVLKLLNVSLVLTHSSGAAGLGSRRGERVRVVEPPAAAKQIAKSVIKSAAPPAKGAANTGVKRARERAQNSPTAASREPLPAVGPVTKKREEW